MGHDGSFVHSDVAHLSMRSQFQGAQGKRTGGFWLPKARFIKEVKFLILEQGFVGHGPMTPVRARRFQTGIKLGSSAVIRGFTVPVLLQTRRVTPELISWMWARPRVFSRGWK